jgi:hypothetical protein
MSIPSKLSPALESRRAEADPKELLDVVVELRAAAPDVAASGKTALEARKEAFERASAPVGEAVRKVGGRVLGSVWLNHTLKVLIPAHALDDLSGLGTIQAIDIPRPLRPEAAGHGSSR